MNQRPLRQALAAAVLVALSGGVAMAQTSGGNGQGGSGGPGGSGPSGGGGASGGGGGGGLRSIPVTPTRSTGPMIRPAAPAASGGGPTATTAGVPVGTAPTSTGVPAGTRAGSPALPSRLPGRPLPAGSTFIPVSTHPGSTSGLVGVVRGSTMTPWGPIPGKLPGENFFFVDRYRHHGRDGDCVSPFGPYFFADYTWTYVDPWYYESPWGRGYVISADPNPTPAPVAPTAAAPAATPLDRATYAMAQGDYTGAIAALEEHLAVNTKDGLAMRSLALAMVLSDNVADGVNMMHRAYDISPSLVTRPIVPSILPRGVEDLHDAMVAAQEFATSSHEAWAYLTSCIFAQGEKRREVALRVLHSAEQHGLEPVWVQRFQAALAPPTPAGATPTTPAPAKP